jgi:hypothetical protein
MKAPTSKGILVQLGSRCFSNLSFEITFDGFKYNFHEILQKTIIFAFAKFQTHTALFYAAGSSNKDFEFRL